MLYTVIPLEKIYADHSKDRKNKTKDSATDLMDAEYKDVMIQHGRIVTRRDGEKYIIENIISTDMKDYLNEQYSPGKDYINES